MRLLARLPYDLIFGTVYTGLKLNLCLVLASLPLLVALGLTGSPLEAWPFFVALSSLCAPAVSAAFATFGGSPFWTAYRAGFVRSLGIGFTAAVLVIVLGVDLQAAVGSSFGVAAPMLALLILLVVSAATFALASPARGGLRFWLACGYLAIRRWYFSLANLAVLGTLAAAVVAKPAIGLFLLPAPALYVIWANTGSHVEGSPR